MIKIGEAYINPESIQRVEREFQPEDDRYEPGNYRIIFLDGKNMTFNLADAGHSSVEDFMKQVRYGLVAYQLGGINELARGMEPAAKPSNIVIPDGH